MQLFASNKDAQTVAAWQASRSADYHCLECHGIVRLRSGPHRQPHFFHLAVPDHCRQHGKSMTHLQIQRHLQSVLGEENCALEHRFSEIDRVADVVWTPERVIFEVQCSPIRAEEVEGRNRDYARLGYQVIWLLHAQRFNRWKVSAAEMALRHQPHYFTDINADGIGEIYDQFDVIVAGIRRHKLGPLTVDISQRRHATPRTTPIVRLVTARLQHYPFYFSGDLTHATLMEPQSAYIAQAAALESQAVPKTSQLSFWRWLWENAIVHPYLCVFQAFLEKVSR